MPASGKLRTLWRLTAGQRPRYAGAVVAMGVSIVLLYAAPQVARIAIDGIVDRRSIGGLNGVLREIRNLGGHRVGPSLAIAGLLVVATTAVSGLFTYLRGRWSAIASESIVRGLRDRLYDHLQHLPVSYHDGAQTGDLVQRCTSDVETIRTFYSTQVVEIGRALLLLASALPILLAMDWRLALISVALMPAIILFAIVFFARVQGSFKATDEAEGRLTAALQENLTGVRVVRAFARQDFEKHRFRQKNAEHQRLNYRLFAILAFYWSMSDLLCSVQVAAVLFAGAWRVSMGTMTVGTLVAFLQYEAMLIWPVRQLGRILSETGKATVSLGRVEEILQQPWESPPASPKKLPAPSRGQLVLRDVRFSHKGRRVLDQISLTIRAGEALAILGPSGAGKSTLINLLLRFYDYDEGSILLDGVELKELDRHIVRSQFAVVMQEPFLYSKTLKENIVLGRHCASEAEAIEAASAAAIHDAIDAFEKKYETLVGERGVTLSGGQRQRVAIARALLRQSPILVLDDALSAIDTQTETAILDALKRRRGRHTTILIAHRLSTLTQADHIVVLDHGRTAQNGTHDQLMNEPGLYRRLWQIQGALDQELQGEMIESSAATATIDDSPVATVSDS